MKDRTVFITLCAARLNPPQETGRDIYIPSGQELLINQKNDTSTSNNLPASRFFKYGAILLLCGR